MAGHMRNIPGVMIPFLFSAFSVFSISMVVPQIAAQFNVPIFDVLLAVPIDFIGGALGGIIMGYVADREGRKIVMIISSIIFGIFTFLASFSNSLYMIYAIWFIIGFGVNSQNGISYPIIVETLKKSSGAIGGTMQSLYFLGFMLDSVLFSFIHYWRTYFIAAGIISLLFSIPGSVIIKETASKRIYRNINYDPNFIRYTIAFSVIVIGAFMFNIPLMADVPSLISALHINTFYVTDLSFVGFGGFVIAGYLSDKLGRETVAIALTLAGAIFGILLLIIRIDDYILIILAFIYLTSGFFSFSGIWVSENYQPETRAFATNIVFFSGRVVGGFSPFIAAIIFPSSLVSGIALVCMVAALLSLTASIYIKSIKVRGNHYARI